MCWDGKVDSNDGQNVKGASCGMDGRRGLVGYTYRWLGGQVLGREVGRRGGERSGWFGGGELRFLRKREEEKWV